MSLKNPVTTPGIDPLTLNTTPPQAPMRWYIVVKLFCDQYSYREEHIGAVWGKRCQALLHVTVQQAQGTWMDTATWVVWQVLLFYCPCFGQLWLIVLHARWSTAALRTSCSCVALTCSWTPLIRTLVIRIANYPDLLGPSGKHFFTVILLLHFMA